MFDLLIFEAHALHLVLGILDRDLLDAFLLASLYHQLCRSNEAFIVKELLNYFLYCCFLIKYLLPLCD